MESVTIFDTAKNIVYGDREQVYGDPGKNIRAIALFWTSYLHNKYGNTPANEINYDEHDICAMMRFVKEARLINTPTHSDSLVDICGYAGVQARINEKI